MHDRKFEAGFLSADVDLEDEKAAVIDENKRDAAVAGGAAEKTLDGGLSGADAVVIADTAPRERKDVGGGRAGADNYGELHDAITLIVPSYAVPSSAPPEPTEPASTLSPHSFSGYGPEFSIQKDAPSPAPIGPFEAASAAFEIGSAPLAKFPVAEELQAPSAHAGGQEPPTHPVAQSAAASPSSWVPGDITREMVIGFAKRAGRYAAYIFAAWFAFVIVLIALYRFVDPPASALMVQQWLGGQSVTQDWVQMERISPQVVRAVIMSEDARFCDHWGIDLVEISNAIERSDGGTPRGASTITMQVAKNLFLWPSKSYVRKVLEVPFTLAIELMWPKRRILEIYLNIAEWGPGVFGVEAGAQAHFSRPAARLGPREAALLAVALPNPIARNAGNPGIGTARLGRVIEARMRGAGLATACIEGRRNRNR